MANKVSGLLCMVAIVILACSNDPEPSHSGPYEVEVLVEGAPFYGAEGIFFDSKDRLHIASVVGEEILIMDPDSGEILERIGSDRGVKAPDDVTIGPDGSIYWTAPLAGEVGRLSPDGVTTTQKVGLGVNPITLSDDGRLFVGLDIIGDAIYELDPDLEELPRLIAEDLGGVNGFDFGPDGHLYAPVGSSDIVRVNVNTERATVEKVAEGAGTLKFDSQGQLFGRQNRSIVQIDLKGGENTVIFSGPKFIDNLAFDSRDRLFAAYHDATIIEVQKDGTGRIVSPGGLAAPSGVAVTHRTDGESVYVVGGGNVLREIDALTGVERSARNIGFAFTVSASGDKLVVSTWVFSTVRIHDIKAGSNVAGGLFETPLNAIWFQGDVVVAELGTQSVVRASGADLKKRTTIAEGIGVPSGLAATQEDLWVGDWAKGTILQIVRRGETLDEPAQLVTGLEHPEGMAVAPDGNLLVVETGKRRLLSIDVETGRILTVAEGLEIGLPASEGAPPTWGFSGVAVGASGAIFVTGEAGNVLYRIDPK